jgi:hypothetical protein
MHSVLKQGDTKATVKIEKGTTVHNISIWAKNLSYFTCLITG